MERKKFDVAILGAGPGGYVAAIKLAQEGLLVALIEKEGLGGSCLNVGCIPTKTLLSSALMLHNVRRASEFGITTGPVAFNYGKMKERKDQVVEKIAKSLRGLLQTNKITILSGKGEFLSPTEIKVVGQDGCLVEADHIIIATGSEPLDIPAFPCDHRKILNSSSMLAQTELPSKLAIVGGGYIGCEFASLYAELGVKVTIVEALPAIVSLQGKAISDALTSAFKKQGIEILAGVSVEKITDEKSGLFLHIKGREPLYADQALIAVGRKICSASLGLEKAGIATTERGAIPVNSHMQTEIPGIYAIGDVTGQFLLAHVASHQALVAAANIVGKKTHMHYNVVPSVIFTYPEIASVGLTLEKAKEMGLAATSGKFPFQALGKSVATMETEGYAEIIIEEKTGQILGAHVIGHDASSLIAEMALAMQNELTIESVSETIHAHPTVAEAWMEAALIAKETPIHLPPKRKM